MDEDAKIKKHNEKLWRTHLSIANATEKAAQHTQALTNAGTPPSSLHRHTRGLETAKRAQAKAQVDLEKLARNGLDLVESGSGKITLELP